MHQQEFSAASFNRLRRKHGQIDFVADDGTQPRTAGGWVRFFQGLEEEVLSGKFRFRPLETSMRNRKRIFFTQNLSNIFVIRRINENIRRAYRVRQSGRFYVIQQIAQALSETAPKYIVRLDIASYYESLRPRRILDRLRADRLVSTTTIELLTRLFRLARHSGANGLPRGIQVSGTLAEIQAQSLEAGLRRVEGIYYLARFVDDLFLLSTRSYSDIQAQVLEVFEGLGLRPNNRKTFTEYVGCKCVAGCVYAPGPCKCIDRCQCGLSLTAAGIHAFNYLGFKLVVPRTNEPTRRRLNPVRTYLADRKIRKIKRRMTFSFREYLRDGDFHLLRDRLLYLTGNHRVDPAKGRGGLLGGVYYDNSRYSPFDDLQVLKENRLEALDDFLLRGLGHCFAARRPASRGQRRSLMSLSFVRGFSQRRMRHFAAMRIREITSCWRHV